MSSQPWPPKRKRTLSSSSVVRASDSEGSQDDGLSACLSPKTIQAQIENTKLNSDGSDSDMNINESNSRLAQNAIQRKDVAESLKVMNEADSQISCNDSNSRFSQVAIGRQDIRESLKVVFDQPKLNETDSQIEPEDSNSQFPQMDKLGEHVEESLKLVTQSGQDEDDHSLSHIGPNSESQSNPPYVRRKQVQTEDVEITFQVKKSNFLSEVLQYDENARDCNTSLDFNTSVNSTESTNISHSKTGSAGKKHPSSEDASEHLSLAGCEDFIFGNNESTPMRETSDLAIPFEIPQLSPVKNDSSSSASSEIINTVMTCASEDSLNSGSPVGSLVNIEIEDDKKSVFAKALSLASGFKTTNLYENSEDNVIEGILQVMDLYIKNKESKSGFRRIVKTVSNLLPKDNSLPSGSKILQFVEDLSPDVKADIHFFCKICIQYYAEKPNRCTVCEAETEIGEFYTFDVVKIIKYLFESRDLASLVDSIPEGDPSLLKDIQDGYVYKNLNIDRGRYDINLVLSTDGVRVRKGSKNELWLLMFTPVEVPPHLRDSYIFIIGVWYDKVKPRGNTFLKPFCDNVKIVENVGVKWKHPSTSITHCSSIRVTLVIADAPARAMCQNIMNHNSKNGCNLCETTTQRTRRVPGIKRKSVFRYVEAPVLRTKQSMNENAELATERGLPIMGVKGPSVLSLLSSVDISQVVIPEFMHSVLLGVTRQVITIWIEKPGDWSIANRLDEIDSLLAQIKHPSFVHRTNRSLQSRKIWKASDYYYFLLFESLVVLSGFLPDLYYQHFLLLVKSIFTLLKRGISEYDILESEYMLKLFGNKFADLYSERDLTYNIHQLLHLALCVRRFGPLSCNSAFPFEGVNGIVAKGCHGTNFVGKEIVNNIKIYQGVVILQNISKGFSVEHSAVRNLKPIVLGRSLQTDLSLLERQFFEDKNISIFSRAKIGCDTYTSEIYKVLKSSNFNVMWELNGQKQYGCIKYFAECQNSSELFMCLRLYEIELVRLLYHTETLKCVEHLVPFKITDNIIFVNVSEIMSSLVKVGIVGSFLFVRPNLIRQIM